jgi:hypothetical protein
MDSVQPVHSWNGNQITEGRLVAAGAEAIASAIARPAAGGSAIMDASVAQYFMNVRRVTPCRASVSINGPCMMLRLLARNTTAKIQNSSA